MQVKGDFAELSTLEELLDFSRVVSADFRFDQYTLNQKGASHILELCDALWLHSGDPQAPHVELTSGKCSDGFVDVLRALRYTNVCEIFAYHLARVIEVKIDQIEGADDADTKVIRPIGWVIGSDHAGAVFSQRVAYWLGGKKHDFTEKGHKDRKEQVWQRFPISPNESVLQVEELMTTAGTLMAVREGIRKGNAYPVTFAPVVGVLVDRSDVSEVEGAPIVSLARYNISMWDPANCPLCAGGSKRFRPKTHWAELTGKA